MPRDPRRPFEITLRLVLVRLVFYGALVLSMLLAFQKKYFLLIPTVFTIIHHVYMSIAPPSFTLPRLVDLVLTVFEAIGLALPFLPIFNKWGILFFDKWMTRISFFSNVMQWALLLFLVISAGSKFYDIIKYGPADRYDITRYLDSDNRPATFVHLVRDIFLGKTPWEPQFTGEPKWIIVSRGALAAWIIAVVSIFACYNMVLETLRQAALTPVYDLRGYYAPLDFTIDQTPVWNVILSKLTDGTDNHADFASAFRVRPLATLEDDPCSWVPELESAELTAEVPNLEHVVFHCPTSMPATGDFLDSAVVSQAIMPDLLITVNFTALNISSTTIVDTPTNSVQLMVGLTNDTYKVFVTTMPTTLIPGINLFGLIRLHIRQIMTSSALSIIGLFDLVATSLISDIDTVWPDPRASPESLIPKALDIATMRLSRQIDDSEWHIIQDHLDKSIIRGLASSGGLWTALGGILSLLFGSSIMRIMFDSKLFSIFGLAHRIQSPKIRDACVREYPRILHDVSGIQDEDRGLTSLMCDHVINVDHLVEPSIIADDQKSSVVADDQVELLPRVVSSTSRMHTG